MQTTLREIITAKDALTNLGNQKLPIKTGYSISKIIKFINRELRDFANTRERLMKEMTDNQDSEHNSTEEIQKILELLVDAEIDLPMNKVDLSSVTGVELTTRDIMTLEPFCIFETTELSMG